MFCVSAWMEVRVRETKWGWKFDGIQLKSHWMPAIFYYNWQFQLEWSNVLKPTSRVCWREDPVVIRNSILSHERVKQTKGNHYLFKEQEVIDANCRFDVESSWHGMAWLCFVIGCNWCYNCVFTIIVSNNWMRIYVYVNVTPRKYEIDLHTMVNPFSNIVHSLSWTIVAIIF